VSWEFGTLMPKAEKKFCAQVISAEPAVLAFHSEASGANVKPAHSSCELKVIGIAAILIDTVDLEDPIQVGNDVTYEVKVTNQGSTEATNVRLTFRLPPQEEFVSGGGATPVHNGEVIQSDSLPTLAPKAAAKWQVIVKARAAGDVRFTVEVKSDQFEKPIREEESTMLY